MTGPPPCPLCPQALRLANRRRRRPSDPTTGKCRRRLCGHRSRCRVHHRRHHHRGCRGHGLPVAPPWGMQAPATPQPCPPTAGQPLAREDYLKVAAVGRGHWHPRPGRPSSRPHHWQLAGRCQWGRPGVRHQTGRGDPPGPRCGWWCCCCRPAPGLVLRLELRASRRRRRDQRAPRSQVGHPRPSATSRSRLPPPEGPQWAGGWGWPRGPPPREGGRSHGAPQAKGARAVRAPGLLDPRVRCPGCTPSGSHRACCCWQQTARGRGCTRPWVRQGQGPRAQGRAAQGPLCQCCFPTWRN